MKQYIRYHFMSISKQMFKKCVMPAVEAQTYKEKINLLMLLPFLLFFTFKKRAVNLISIT